MKTQIWTHSDWSIRKWQGSYFFKVLKIEFFQYWSYFSIFSLIIWWFEVRDVSNDREFFSLQNSLFLLFFECHFLWDSSQIWKNTNAIVVINFQCYGRMSYQSKRSQAEFLICCSPAHRASFGILPFEKFHQEMIKFFFTQDRICHDFIHFMRFWLTFSGF